MMGIKMPKHVEILLITNKSLFVASSWFLLYLLIKDARSFEHKNHKQTVKHKTELFGRVMKIVKRDY